ncbi:MAG: 3-methyl-2-oxobutanoate dehydrogenase subunit VorB [Dehalococcoidia bacterium]|nr:3-methyl-2-oxobutanoate dehydrogenase subunit VorB [Dehalococcoidia bacterium]
MTERVLIDGNEAICRGALAAGCRYYFGYPITPQNEIPEFMSRELRKIGGVFVQTEDELSAINMLYGAAAAGARAMTSTSSVGISLMQETMSHMSTTETPAVVVDVARLGPGQGTIQTGQTDYLQATKAGGHGGYHVIVLAPASPQDCFDYIQLAFYLADKYRMETLVLSDFTIGRMAEPVELTPLEFRPLPEKDWALRGTAAKGGKRNIISSGHRLTFEIYGMGIPEIFSHFQAKYDNVAKAETRYITYLAEDAQLLLVAYGSSARIAEGAVNMARAEGIRVGLLRPITLWPFPKQALREQALRAGNVLVVEDSQGQLVEDVQCIVQGQVPVHLLGIWGRHDSSPSGMIHPERVLQEVKSLL